MPGRGLLTKTQSEALAESDPTYPHVVHPHSPDADSPDDDHEYYVESHEDAYDDFDYDDSTMLPPTTSTYNPQTQSIPPPPDPDVLRRQLRQSLAVTKVTWEKAGVNTIVEEDFDEGYEGLQGRELVELGTAAVRAAKSYYYTTDISLLTSKDDKTLRDEFLSILDTLKRMEDRHFEGGVRHDEQQALLGWITEVESALTEEEKAISEIRSKGREWLEGSWDGREYGMFPQTPTCNSFAHRAKISTTNFYPTSIHRPSPYRRTRQSTQILPFQPPS